MKRTAGDIISCTWLVMSLTFFEIIEHFVSIFINKVTGSVFSYVDVT